MDIAIVHTPLHIPKYRYKNYTKNEMGKIGIEIFEKI